MIKARSAGLALALVGTSLALGLATLALAGLNARHFSYNRLLADLLPALSFALVAALILAYRSRHVLGWLMLLIGLLFLLEPFGNLYATYALITRPGSLPGGELAALVSLNVWGLAYGSLVWLEATPLEALDLGQRREESVPLLLEGSLAQVSEPARQALAVAGLLALAPFGREGVAAGLGVAPGPAGKWLGELVNYGLLLRRDERYEVSHALVHRYARERVELPAGVVERVAGYHTVVAEEQSELGAPGYARLDGERGHILAVADQATRQGVGRAALRLVWASDSYLRLQGYQTERRTALQTGLEAARSLADRGQEARCIKHLGDVHYRVNEYRAARARYEEARPIYAGIDDRPGEANCIRALGDVHRMQAEYQAASARYEEARPIYAGIGARLGEANCIKALGDIHRMLNEHEAARARYEEARPLFAQIGARFNHANTLAFLGLTYKGLAQPGPARQHLTEAIAIYEAIKSPWVDWAREQLASLDEETSL